MTTNSPFHQLPVVAKACGSAPLCAGCQPHIGCLSGKALYVSHDREHVQKNRYFGELHTVRFAHSLWTMNHVHDANSHSYGTLQRAQTDGILCRQHVIVQECEKCEGPHQSGPGAHSKFGHMALATKAKQVVLNTKMPGSVGCIKDSASQSILSFG